MFSKRFIILLFLPTTIVYADSINIFNSEKSILFIEEQSPSKLNFTDSTYESVDFFELSKDPLVQKKVNKRETSERIESSKINDEAQKKTLQNQLDQKTLDQIIKMHPQNKSSQP